MWLFSTVGEGGGIGSLSPILACHARMSAKKNDNIWKGLNNNSKYHVVKK